jgi:L,D-peptidoglycan transpeptidase YkuD (ErfK/YbiS/YcfS/YnhG family)
MSPLGSITRVTTWRRLGVGRFRRAVAGGAAVVLMVGAAAATAASAPPGSRLPMGMSHADGSRQMIVVTAPSARSTVATLRAFALTGGSWRLAFHPIRARVGRHGWIAASRRREGDGTTPEGIFTFGTTLYGTRASPGTAYRFHRLVPGDYWDENPATGVAYNTFRHLTHTNCARNPFGRGSECLWRGSPAYNYLAVINFNTPATGPYGSGIFLHVGLATATSGCVSVAQSELVRILRWLRPAAVPRIVLAGPTSPSRY